MNRYIFTKSRPSKLERITNIIGPIVLGVGFAVLALDYFDVLMP